MDRLVSDEIPNIRFNVAKSYSELIKVLKQVSEDGTLETDLKGGKQLVGTKRGTTLIHEKVVPNLEKLQLDTDVDVRYFATTAAQSITADGDDVMKT
jgi:serine/threonine-protein phosphatase 2A regulatory subunit A